MNLIAHFCASPVAPGQSYGGVSNVVTALACRSSMAGIPTLVVCGDSQLGNVLAEAGERELSDHLRVVTIRLKTSGSVMRRHLTELIAELPAGTVAHVHAGFSPFTDRAMRLLKRRGIPYVYSPHGKLSRGMLRSRRLAKLAYLHLSGLRVINAASRIGVFARGETELFSELGIRIPTVEIPNGYEYPLERSSWVLPTASNYVLYLGYLDPRKQPDLLIRAFAASRARTHALLLLVGPDAYGEGLSLRALTESLNVADRVVFHGAAYGSEKWGILANARVLCLPSLAEGMPLVLVEALAAHTPSIFSAQSNGNLIAQHGAGIELSSFDPEVWAEAIDHLFEDTDLWATMKMRAQIAAPSLEWGAISEAWIGLYRELTP